MDPGCVVTLICVLERAAAWSLEGSSPCPQLEAFLYSVLAVYLKDYLLRLYLFGTYIVSSVTGEENSVLRFWAKQYLFVAPEGIWYKEIMW